MLYQGCLSGGDEDSNFMGQDTVVNYKEGKRNKLIGNAGMCICLFVCMCVCVHMHARTCLCEIRAFRSTHYI